MTSDSIGDTPSVVTPNYFFSVAAVFRDEGRYLREWVEYYRLVGADHLYLYCHDTPENYREAVTLLRKHLDSGFVDLSIVADTSDIETHEFWLAVAEHAFARAAAESEWFAMLDLDEFLFPAAMGEDVPAVLRRLSRPDLGGLAVNWAVYGSNGQLSPPRLQTETFLGRAKNDYKFNYHFKTVVRCRAAVGPAGGNHYYSYRRGWVCEGVGGHPVIGGLVTKPVFDPLVINHYRLRSFSDYVRKFSRPRLPDKAGTRSLDNIVTGFRKHDSAEVHDSRLWKKYGQRLLEEVYPETTARINESVAKGDL